MTQRRSSRSAHIHALDCRGRTSTLQQFVRLRQLLPLPFPMSFARLLIEADASVCRHSRNAICPGRRFLQQHAERTRVPLQGRIWLPYESCWGDWFLRCIPVTFVFGTTLMIIFALFTAAMGATFATAESIVANQWETQDALYGVAGGCAAIFFWPVSEVHAPAT